MAAVERRQTGQCVEPPAGIGEALEGAVLVTGPRPLQSRLLRGVDVPAQLPRRLAVRSYGVQVLGKLGGPVLVGIGVLCQHARRGRRGGGVGDARCVRRGRGRGCPAERVLAEGTRRGQCRQHAGVRGRFRREPDLARLGQDRFRRPVRCRRGQVVKGVQHGVGGGLDDVGERLGRRRQNLVEARLLAVALGGGVGESGALEELLGEGERTVGGDGGLAQEEMNVRSGVTGPGRTGDDGGGVRGAVGGRHEGDIGVQAVLRGGEPAAGVEVGRDPLADGLLDVGELFRGERRFGGDRQGEGDVTGPVATGVGGCRARCRRGGRG
ncbi:hypothetical protein SFUMM280S_05712 [Streptomyces fumanus]